MQGYSAEQIAVYIKLSVASGKTRMTDGATIVKTFMDVPGMGFGARCCVTITAYVTQE
jgi:hypothetical protein